MEPSERALGLLTGPTGAVLRATLAPAERLTHAVPAIGCTIALTTRRLLIIRDGSAFRPVSGIREWPLEQALDVRPGLVRQGAGSVAIRHGRDVTSVFVPAREWEAALGLIGALRGRIRRDAAERRADGT
jgi:hypothetical protein